MRSSSESCRNLYSAGWDFVISVQADPFMTMGSEIWTGRIIMAAGMEIYPVHDIGNLGLAVAGKDSTHDDTDLTGGKNHWNFQA